MEGDNNMPQLQSSLVNKLIKKYAGDNVIGSEYRQEV
jgi:hypothetical protein